MIIASGLAISDFAATLNAKATAYCLSYTLGSAARDLGRSALRYRRVQQRVDRLAGTKINQAPFAQFYIGPQTWIAAHARPSRYKGKRSKAPKLDAIAARQRQYYSLKYRINN